MGVLKWQFAAVCGLVLFGCGGTVRPGARETGDGGPENGGTSGTRGTGGRAGSPTGGKGGAAKACPSPLTSCGGSCVNTQSNSSHCGSCNAACTSGVPCVNGSCQDPSNGCPSGLTYCSNLPFSNARCFDLRSNAFACGSCYTPCVNSEACVDGKCIAGTCFPGLTLCAGLDGSSRCADLSIDRNNCGTCNNQCGPAESCQQGKCVPPECGFPYIYCRDTGCIDPTYDVTNCGKCGNSCTGGSVFDYSPYACTNGTCGCAPLANVCGTGCATQFWYCPIGSSGSPADVCMQTARNAYQRCACKSCLAEVTNCSTDPSCVNAMDCSLPSTCVGCGDQTFTLCTDGQGRSNPLAEKLVACMNSACQAPGL